MTRPLLLTTGEPAGIGPELALMLAARGQLANTVAVGDPQMLRQRAALLGLAVEVVEAAPGGLDISSPGVGGVARHTASACHAWGARSRQCPLRVGDTANCRRRLPSRAGCGNGHRAAA